MSCCSITCRSRRCAKRCGCGPRMCSSRRAAESLWKISARLPRQALISFLLALSRILLRRWISRSRSRSMSEEFALLDRDLIAKTGGFWRVSVFRETESTNDIVLRAAEGGEPEGFAVFAEAQTRGRGQFGRRWDSAPGLGLW